MADLEGNKVSKNFHLDKKSTLEGFHVKGLNHSDWGMKTRLSKIFNEESGNSVILAFDHGYIMGPTSGLERLDIVVPPLLPHIDVLMATRGGLRSCISPACGKGIALRCTAGRSVLDDDLSNEFKVVDTEEVIRMNASCMAIQVFIGSKNQHENLKELNRAVNEGTRYGIPTMGVVAVGKEMSRTKEYFLLATRMIAEFGAHIIKTYYCEGFEEVVAACPVPIVVAGGKKIPEKDALNLTYMAIKAGARGVDMGRNIFQAENPVAMAEAVSLIVHKNYTDEEAYEIYLKNK
ncbi:3-hydroxy-5-phosphonooxypentane-2,4-dione thiolase [Ilyobacter polytropus]|uniref:Deoxyribose-phosphate aldolase/phospho-2-dehydro-3-deoxyheptonate aldolase n=1 Tax=Ilyobacter polytropus (strain ATCC 51220 / DSM 2926 / LMG 16218 / CuHBu1) TaxID=572544 RepID=E3HB86_ILYPC|nr:3-hydroxy-5-phosphonooxypentane-2,4-dione thiolase [Ilyobacter polytropus]ADO82237.1 deoxyribose-phosphate aldolase/phospho-2-dehydro-3-deoxyheptonate aldolase [Ilyobacter polytropus DSM 2926]